MRDVPFKELDIRGSRNSLNLIPQALEILNKRQDLAEALITHTFDFHQLGKAFETMEDRSAQVGKIVIDMPVTTVAEPAELFAEVHN